MGPNRFSGPIEQTVLASGLRVVTEQVAGARSFSVGFFVPVGSRHESVRRHGASHFLEHLLFKGTPTRSAEDISIAVESVGGDLNAYTAREHTCFYGRVLDTDADLATDVLADMIANSLIRTADVDSERAVILDEIAMHADDPGEVAQEIVMTALFGGRGLGVPVIGSTASILAMTRAQVVAHWRRHYRTDALVVAASGRVDHERLVDRLSVLPAATDPAPLSTLPASPASDGGLISVRRPNEQSTAMLAFPAGGVFDPRRYAVGLLSVIVGGGMSSRLFVEVRERRGLTYGIDAGETCYTDAGLWTVDWQCAPERLTEITELVRAILLDVAEHGVTAEELVRAKGQLRGQTMLAYEGPVQRMSRLGGNALIGDDRTLDEVIAGFDAVTADEVREAAAAIFGRPPVLAVVGPRASTARLGRRLAHW